MEALPVSRADNFLNTKIPIVVTDQHFNEQDVLDELKHYLPAQAPLKDFVHHNTLHPFQHMRFFEGIRTASKMFGYKVSFTLAEFRKLYETKRIREDVLDHVIANRKSAAMFNEWKQKVLFRTYRYTRPRIGILRSNWRRHYRIDLDSLVHPLLFRILCSYLDQGISMWSFPAADNGLLASIRDIEKNSFTSFFKSERAKRLLIDGTCELSDLLKILVGDESLYKQYLFDQQFAHQGWSGMVATIERRPETLLDRRGVSLYDLIMLETLLEIDALDFHMEKKWSTLSAILKQPPTDLFAKVALTEKAEVLAIWQNAFEETYYDEVLAGLRTKRNIVDMPSAKSFQAIFCIDDRSSSLRDYLERVDTRCETFATPGFFGVEFYFKPDQGQFFAKQCPPAITPRHLIKEIEATEKRTSGFHFAEQGHSVFRGWLATQTLGFWSALRLVLHIFRPSLTAAAASSHEHIDKAAKLTILNQNTGKLEEGLQVGFTVEEMADRVEKLLKSIGMTEDFAPFVYVIGHGSSSVNNPHYAAYDCGACSGRPGGMNARVISFMANHSAVRKILRERGLPIPDTTRFMGGLHDTTRDDILFYEEDTLSSDNAKLHASNKTVFLKALDYNAKERSRRFESINPKRALNKIHQAVRLRSVALFEPRPELNHATNALCIVGRRSLTKNLFLDRRAFMNSFDYRIDPEGTYLREILKAAAPVCGGINLEYYFSRVDNQKLGAGTKLPHNVMGLFGVANGIDGDLRPGLPSQMIEVHDPIRLLIIVEHFPDVVLKSIQEDHETYEWFINEWIHLVVIHPDTNDQYRFREGRFVRYQPLKKDVPKIPDINQVIESRRENLPVYVIDQTPSK